MIETLQEMLKYLEASVKKSQDGLQKHRDGVWANTPEWIQRAEKTLAKWVRWRDAIKELIVKEGEKPMSTNEDDFYGEQVPKLVNLKQILMELGNRLVTKHGFVPAGSLPTNVPAKGDTTWSILHFTQWLNYCPQAREELATMGIEWPVVEQRDVSALRELGAKIPNQPIHLIEPVKPGGNDNAHQ